jgi:FlaA1/EpsC-like NDP-sugar epimerase
MLSYFLEAPRSVKRFISVTYDCCAISLSLYLAWALRLGQFDIGARPIDWLCLVITLAISITAFIRLGLYRAILRYMAHEAVVTVMFGTLISSLSLAASDFFLKASLPRSVPIIYVFTSLFFVAMPRLFIRSLVQMLMPRSGTKVIIYGAGKSGSQLASAAQHSTEFWPVAFVDDDKKLHGSSVRGLSVLSPTMIPQLIKDHSAEKILLALGNTPRCKMRWTIRTLEEYSIKVQTIPAFSDLVNERTRIEELRDIEIEDLLGRDPVQGNSRLMDRNIGNKVVMVTGAGGSIGSELCRQIIIHSPIALILFELNEYNLYKIEDELSRAILKSNFSIELVPLLGSVQHKNRVEKVMSSFGVDTVYHAAAYKHVPMVEQNLIEGVRNNLFGTQCCAEAAIAAGVKTFVLVSTDKAVRPTNIMGASKRLAEIMLQSLASTQTETKICMVRFGNVLGSSGSVVPKFQEQIARGGPVTITHPEITRYFMTISEAAQLVIQAGSMAKGGDVFVLEMGDPVKIVDLAKEMISLSGLTIKDENNPNADIEIQFSGLRPGEKLYEELLVEQNCHGTEHPRIMRAEESHIQWEDAEKLLNRVDKQCHEFDYEGLRAEFVASPASFKPLNDIDDLIYKKMKVRPQFNLIKAIPKPQNKESIPIR